MVRISFDTASSKFGTTRHAGVGGRPPRLESRCWNRQVLETRMRGNEVLVSVADVEGGGAPLEYSAMKGKLDDFGDPEIEDSVWCDDSHLIAYHCRTKECFIWEFGERGHNGVGVAGKAQGI